MSEVGRGKLVIISGPSGAGKSSVVARLLETCHLPLELSVSATTRPPRPNEVDGKNYHFISQQEFEARRSNGEFLETVEVFGQGIWYGTLLKPVDDSLDAGRWVILEIDVAGALKVLNSHPDAITIFVHPGSMEELENRLRSRGTESDENIRQRLAVAQSEMEMASAYQHIVVNEIIDETADTICSLLTKFGEHSCTTN